MSESADRDAPPPLAEAVGGALGIAESVLPSAAFVATYTAVSYTHLTLPTTPYV